MNGHKKYAFTEKIIADKSSQLCLYLVTGVQNADEGFFEVY